MEKLNTAFQAASQDMYQASNGEASGSAATNLRQMIKEKVMRKLPM